jgi:hypothetical protein
MHDKLDVAGQHPQFGPPSLLPILFPCAETSSALFPSSRTSASMFALLMPHKCVPASKFDEAPINIAYQPFGPSTMRRCMLSQAQRISKHLPAFATGVRTSLVCFDQVICKRASALEIFATACSRAGMDRRRWLQWSEYLHLLVERRLWGLIFGGQRGGIDIWRCQWYSSYALSFIEHRIPSFNSDSEHSPESSSPWRESLLGHAGISSSTSSSCETSNGDAARSSAA